ncbi:hypothetical protein MPSI1_001794 [Malassezia psittaci]|uniref:Mediator of RNA polymerase II transcription subunit 13 n=1 Tax=Malassezia psittaci TaxID=1821823 RepID=A0AAF0JK62_9BASI|nr:hypothetical protein MPSI1_001794 [Malassezia psittaci]
MENDAALWLINVDATLCEDWDADLAELEVCDSGDPATIQAGESQILLLPSLVEATFLGTDPYTSTAASIDLAEALHPTLSRINLETTLYCRVCVTVESPPLVASTDALNMGLNLGNSSVPITLCWPLELCLQRICPDDQNNLHPTPLRQRSVRSLVEAHQKEFSLASVKELGIRKNNVLLPRLPVQNHRKGAMDDDIYSGIGQLTEDDLRFFDEPGPYSTQYDELGKKTNAVPDFGPDQSSDAVLDRISPMITPLNFSSLSLPITDATDSLSTSLLMSPGCSSRISDKYDPQGKFYTPAPSSSRKRAHSFELVEGRKSSRINQHPTTSQVSEVSSPDISGSSSTSSSSPDDNENMLVVLALQISRLHVSEWMVTHEASDEFLQVDCSAFSLALATSGYVKARRPILVPPKWDALSTKHTSVQLNPPRVLVGNQRAIIETDLDALQVWPIMGLEPIDGPKNIRVAVVLVGEFDTRAVTQWLDAVEQSFASLRLGTFDWSQLLFWRSSKLNQANGGLASLSDAFPMSRNADSWLVLLMFAPDTREDAEKVYERWRSSYVVLPIPRSSILSCTTLHADELASHAHKFYTAAPRTDMTARPSVALSPTHYEQCQILRPKSALRLGGEKARSDTLRHGSVLHVAYDIHQVSEGVGFRIVGIDDRAQRTFSHTGTSCNIMEGIEQIWSRISTELCTDLCVEWHVIICRAGPPLVDEVGKWSILEQKNLIRENENVSDVTLACVDVQMFFVDLPKHIERQFAINLPESMAPAQGSSFLALCSSYIANPHLNTGWSVHLLQVFCDETPESIPKMAYLNDVVIHLAALEHLGSLRRTPQLAALPWHLAALLYHVDY